MPAKGNLIKTDSTCSSADGNDGIGFSGTTLSGALKVDSKCHVTGQFTINIGKTIGGTLDPSHPVVDVERKIESKVDAFISKGKDSISGMMYESVFTPPIFNNGLQTQTLINSNVAVLPINAEFTWSSVFTGVKL